MDILKINKEFQGIDSNWWKSNHKKWLYSSKTGKHYVQLRPLFTVTRLKLNKAFFALLKLRPTVLATVPIPTLLTAYYALVYPHLSYNTMLWGQSSNINRLLIAQKRILHLIFGLTLRESCREIFKSRKILTLPSIYILKCSLYVFKNINQFQSISQAHDYNTRSRHTLAFPIHKSTFFEKSPFYAGIRIYNKLPTEIKDSNSARQFRRRLIEYLTEKAYYSVREFQESHY